RPTSRRSPPSPSRWSSWPTWPSSASRRSDEPLGRSTVSALYEFHEHPELESPALVVVLDGWIDAGLGAQQARACIDEQVDSILVATFDTDALLDHRARRPTMHLVDGVHAGLEWPSIELRAATDPAGNELLLLVGVEPDHQWQAFSSAVADLALELSVRLVVGLGAYPAPHRAVGHGHRSRARRPGRLRARLGGGARRGARGHRGALRLAQPARRRAVGPGAPLRRRHAVPGRRGGPARRAPAGGRPRARAARAGRAGRRGPGPHRRAGGPERGAPPDGRAARGPGRPQHRRRLRRPGPAAHRRRAGGRAGALPARPVSG